MVEYFGEIETKFESYFASLIYKGPRWVGIMKKMKVENLVTHSLFYTDVSAVSVCHIALFFSNFLLVFYI